VARRKSHDVRCRKARDRDSFFSAILLWAVLVAAIALGSCGGGSTAPAPPPPPSVNSLSAGDVDAVVTAAAASVDAGMVIAVVDRGGKILAVFETPGAPTLGLGNFGANVNARELAIALARTAGFFSNNQAPLSSRTVRFISGVHFPPGVANAPVADLYGIENTNRGCFLSSTYLPGQSLARATLSDGTSPGLGIITGKANLSDSDATAVNPGGVPLFKEGAAVGGVGVVSTSNSVSEFAAFSGAAAGFLPTSLPPPGVVIVGGIALPFVEQRTLPSGATAGSTAGAYVIGPVAGGLPPEGYLVGPVAGAGGLTQDDVATIISQALATAQMTRAVIRLPQGSRTRMTFAVSDLDGTVLGLYRMPDGTVFSADVAVTKARNVIWFSGAGSADLAGVPATTAVTNRTIGFGAEPMYPPGIDGAGAGPFFNLFTGDVANPCTQGSQAANVNQSGIVFFPGSLPLYKNGGLVGGLGVSGDGVDQDDFVTAAGATGFEAPQAIRADQVVIDGVRLPYLKFPRNPTQ